MWEENMKKIILIAICALIIGIFLFVLFINIEKQKSDVSVRRESEKIKVYEETLQAVEELNQNSNLGVSFLQKCNENGIFNSQAPVGGSLGEDKIEGQFYYFPYPYDESRKTDNYRDIPESDCVLTQLNLRSSNYDVLGIKVGDAKDSVDVIMKKYGYSQKIEKDPYDEAMGIESVVYEKYDIHIYFTLGDDISIIDEIDILVFSQD
jgi:competence protein ComGC